MNQITLMGRIVNDLKLEVRKGKKDLEFKDTKFIVLRFTLAVARDEDKTDFINCVAYNKIAKSIVEYTDKGKRILIHGNLRIDNIKQDDKIYKNFVNVIVNNINIIDFKDSKKETKEEVLNELPY